MAIDYKYLLQALSEFLNNNIEYNMSSLNNKNIKNDSIWAKIYFSMYGTFNSLKVLDLYTAWKNNNYDIKTKLLNDLNNMKGKFFY